MRTSIGLAVLLLADSAFAFTYPGASCEKEESAGNRSIDGNGHVENVGTDTLHLVCPLTVDDPIGGGLPFQLSSVFVTDFTNAPGDGRVCCQARVKYVGASVGVGSELCTADTTQNANSVTLSPNVPGNTQANAARFLHCTLPEIDTGAGSGTSEIRAYSYTE